MKKLANNWQTNYRVGQWFSFGYIPKKIVDIRQDENGFNEYLLDSGNYTEWVTGRYIIFCSD